MKLNVNVVVNGRSHALEVSAHDTLSDVLRERLGLTGCKVACDQSVCGACTVLVDGEPVSACSTFMFKVDGGEIMTVEGLATGGVLTCVQEAFLRDGAFQCGFCTSGMILLVTALLARHPNPDDATIQQWLSSNICRCTGYNSIVAAVRRAAAGLRTEAAA